MVDLTLPYKSNLKFPCYNQLACLKHNIAIILNYFTVRTWNCSVLIDRKTFRSTRIAPSSLDSSLLSTLKVNNIPGSTPFFPAYADQISYSWATSHPCI